MKGDWKMNLRFLLLCCPYVFGLVSNSADAAVKIGNLSRANKAQAYQQVNETRYQADLTNQQAMMQAAVATIPQELPVVVSNQELAQQIQSGNPQAAVSMAQLEKCSRIYPNGQFEWSRPTLGRGAGGATTCVAVVEMRAVQAGPNGEDLVVARGNLAAGDFVNCNISAFPQATWLPDAGNVEFPADAEPTRDDVVAVMNEEQKQHAGLKILAGGLVAAVAGNAMGDSEPGKDGLFGTGKSKLKSTAVGALGGAGLMAASTYGGKVGGDIIMSAGVNAAAGALIGNMSASGDSVLRVEKCVIDGRETTCMYGNLVQQGSAISSPKTPFVNKNNPNQFMVCQNGFEDCEYARLMGEKINPSDITDCGVVGRNAADCTYQDIVNDSFSGVKEMYCYREPANTPNAEKQMFVDNENNNCGGDTEQGPWIKLSGASEQGASVAAMMIDVEDKPFGWKMADFERAMNDRYKDNAIYQRDANGLARGDAIAMDAVTDVTYVFKPISVDAADGGLIDMDNKARMKSTLVGAGSGAGLGAFTAYQGAQTEIEERWVSAIREYKDSLNKFYCVTGKRPLATYNDLVQIPSLPE